MHVAIVDEAEDRGDAEQARDRREDLHPLSLPAPPLASLAHQKGHVTGSPAKVGSPPVLHAFDGGDLAGLDRLHQQGMVLLGRGALDAMRGDG
jgi:hypothetical protein